MTLAGLPAIAHPQQAMAPRPAEQAPITLPVTYQKQILILTLTDTKLGPLHMLVDTGAETTLLSGSATSIGAIDFNNRPFEAVRGSGSEASIVIGTTSLDLHMGSTPIFSTTVAVMDLRRISRTMPHRIDGILGWDFFQHWCIRIDYSHQQITLTPPASCAAPHEKHTTLVGEWLKEGYLVPAHLNFSPSQSADALLHLDTGADPPITLNSQFLKFATIHDSPQQGHGIGGEFTNDSTELSSADLDYGHIVLNDGPIPALIARKGGFNNGHWWNIGRAEARLNHDGIVGNGLLQRFTLTFDPAHKRIYAENAAGHPQQPDPPRP